MILSGGSIAMLGVSWYGGLAYTRRKEAYRGRDPPTGGQCHAEHGRRAPFGCTTGHRRGIGPSPASHLTMLLQGSEASKQKHWTAVSQKQSKH